MKKKLTLFMGIFLTYPSLAGKFDMLFLQATAWAVPSLVSVWSRLDQMPPFPPTPHQALVVIPKKVWVQTPPLCPTHASRIK